MYINRGILLKFYSPELKKLILVHRQHKAHFYSDEDFAEYQGVESCQPIEVFDCVRDETRLTNLITVNNPVLLNEIAENHKIYESDVKYNQSYLYDNNFIVANWYYVYNAKKIVPIESRNDSFDLSNIDLDSVVDVNNFESQLKKWANILDQEIPDLKRLAFDIEVETSDKLPDPLNSPNRVTAISFHSDDLKKVLVLNRGEDKAYNDNFETIYYDSEKKMLEDAFKIIESYPIVLTFNGDMFDMPYLYNRALNLGITHNPFKMMKTKATLNYGIHIDVYGIFSNRSLKIYAFNGKYVEEGLNSVAKAMLGEEKTKYEGDLNTIPVGLLAEYCYNDSRLTYNLTSFNNNLVMNLLMLMCRIGNMSIDDISRLSISNWIKSMLYFYHIQNGQLIPISSDFPKVETSTTALIKDKKYQGAVVLDQEKGIHFNVVVMDFASLYPSIIKTRNISYETICCPHEECKSNKIPYTNHWSCTKKIGIVSLLIGSLKELRVNHYKKLLKSAKTEEEKEKYDMITQALKVFLNASYGVIGFESFPLYFLPVAESITAVGRDIILETVKTAQDMNLKILAGDTDSIFIHNPSKEKIQSLIEYARTKYAIDLEVDKTYRYLVLSGRKKNYFGVKDNGKLDIKGLSGKKSNTPPYLKKLFNDVLDELVKINVVEDFVEAKQTISSKIKHVYDNFEEIPLEQLALNVMINKEPSEYKTKPQCLIAAQQLPGKPEKGQFVQYVKTWNEPHVKPLQLAQPKDIDKTKYIEGFETVLEQVVEPMDIDIDFLLGRGKMTTMEDFW